MASSPASSSSTLHEINGLSFHVIADPVEFARLSAQKAASIIRDAVGRRGRARLLVATGNSQVRMMAALVNEPEVPWEKVEAFHLDEYAGITADHPASFRYWIRHRFEERVPVGAMRYIEGDAADLDDILRRYGELLTAAPIDLAFVGIGENGHIAFNDPHAADFDDPLVIKRVVLDEACRRQQVGEGHFASLADVPVEAATVTCSGLMRAENWVCCVPEARKAKAVRAALTAEISTGCPATLVRRHPRAFLFLDAESAALLPGFRPFM